MLMSFGGHAASSSGCAIGPREVEIGLTGSAGRTHISLPTGSYAMATAEHREPCESRGSCTVLGAPGGEIPPGDSTTPAVQPRNTRYQADAAPYLGRTSTGWIAPACGWRTHSITSSTLARIAGGIARPSALAVLRFTTNSNFVGSSTGKSAGLAPFSNLSTKVPARRKRAAKFGP